MLFLTKTRLVSVDYLRLLIWIFLDSVIAVWLHQNFIMSRAKTRSTWFPCTCIRRIWRQEINIRLECTCLFRYKYYRVKCSTLNFSPQVVVITWNVKTKCALRGTTCFCWCVAYRSKVSEVLLISFYRKEILLRTFEVQKRVTVRCICLTAASFDLFAFPFSKQ